jgi:hypothetical protein
MVSCPLCGEEEIDRKETTEEEKKKRSEGRRGLHGLMKEKRKKKTGKRKQK